MGAQRQRLYDAIKQARDTGEAWVTHAGQRMRLRPFAEDDDEYRPASHPRPDGCVHESPGSFGWPPHYLAFVKARVRGGVALAEVWWHEGRLHVEHCDSHRRAFRRANDDIILAIVAETHPRGGADGAPPA